MSLSSRTLGRIESLVTVAKMSATEHKMLLKIVEDAVNEAVPAAMQGEMMVIPSDWPEDYFDQFYSRYPNKKAPDRARKALDKIAASGKTRFADLISGLERYILFDEDVRRGFVQHPATWLNGGCWKNQEQTTPRRVERKSSFDVAADLLSGSYGQGTGHDGYR